MRVGPRRHPRQRRAGTHRLITLMFLVALAVGLGTAPARAACSVDAQPVAFGTVDARSATSGVGSIIVRCDSATDVDVAIGGDSGGREMRGQDGTRLAYGLFLDPGHRREWGGIGFGELYKGTAPGDDRLRITVYGLIPSQPSAMPGQYSDQLEITVSF